MNNKQINNLSNLLKEIDIVKLIKNYISLNKKGKNYWGICPFHNDSSPSMSVSDTKGFFKCFACNHSGNAIKFVMDYKKITFYEAVKEIEEVLNLNLKISNLNVSEHDVKLINLMNLVKDTYEGFLFRDENKDKLQYLLDRKISLQQIQKFSLGYATDKQKQIFDIALNKNNIRGFNLEKSDVFNLEDMELTKLINIDKNGDIHDFFKNRIIIPIFDETNNVVAFSGRSLNNETPKYMNSPTSQIFKKEEILYNMNNLNPTVHTCYLVEGFMDLYALDSIGIQNPFATMGTAFSESHLKWLINNKITDIVLCFDNDKAGNEATIKTGLKIGKKLNVFTLKQNQTNLKDFNDILVKASEDELMKVVSSTIHFSVFYLEYFLKNADNNGDINKQNNFNVAIEIIKNNGNSLYNNEYK
ncbi:MAG: DNA primase, partial [Ureaplasma sp.]|nr:DNA primase [Ureaplasma sp.]